MLGSTVFDYLDMRDLDLLDAEVIGADAYGDNMVAAFQQAKAQQQAQPAASPVPAAIASGNRDENHLTDLEFFSRHPERSGAPIQKSDKALAKEWLQIRDQVVRPALARVGVPARAAGRSASPPPPGSNAAIAEQAAADMNKNRIIAGVLGGLALLGIGVAVATR